MKTTFDLPEPLLRRAKAAAALRGSSLRDLVAEAIEVKLGADEASQTPSAALSRWENFKARLVLEPDGSYRNPNGIEDEPFFETLEALRRPPTPTGSSDGRAALRTALVRQPDGGYVNLLGYDGPSFDDALALARSAMHAPEPTDFDTPGDASADDTRAGA